MRNIQWDNYESQIKETGQVQVRTVLLALSEQMENMAELAARPEALTENILQQISHISKRVANTIGAHAMSHDEDEMIEAGSEDDLDAAEIADAVEDFIRGID